MQFKQAIIILISAHGLVASPVANPDPTHIEIARVVTGEGDLVYYGASEASKIARKDLHGLDKRESCFLENTVDCANNNQAFSDLCNTLIGGLDAQGSVAIPSNSRSVCVQRNDRCCVSWNRDITGLFNSDLVNPARSVFNKCNRNNLISGISKDVVLAQTCARLCLSNGGDDCN